VSEFLTDQSSSRYSYREPGYTKRITASERTAPRGFVVDDNRIRVGDGPDAFHKGVLAMRRWAQFNVGWVRVSDPSAPIEPGVTVAVIIHHYGFYSMNAARIIYTIDEPGLFGFAYGTLQGHAERGEERFLLRKEADGSVWYELFAFSRTGHWMARCGYPLVRRLQKRFARDSMATMQHLVSGKRPKLAPSW
jgi:uncharacterized protein (UPF0548 family)